MRRVLGVLLIAFMLSGCAIFREIQNPINKARLVEIEAAYGAVLSVANGYRQLYKINRCTVTNPESITNYCARRSVVLALQTADQRAQVTLRAARKWVAANPTLDASAVLGAFEAAVDAMRQIEQVNGVR